MLHRVTLFILSILASITITALIVHAPTEPERAFARRMPTTTALPQTQCPDLIAFASAHEDHDDIHVINADGSDRRNLTAHPADDTDPVWSPDGTQIAFVSNRHNNFDIFVMNADGSQLRQVTDSPGDERDPDWSPTGDQIVFASDQGGRRNIYIINADGSESIQLTHGSGESWSPVWSPDGTRIAFTSDRAGNDTLYIMDTDGDNVQTLTEPDTYNRSPMWHPDGNLLTFITTRGARHLELYTMRPDGSEQQQLLRTIPVHWFDWSPDGTHIVFEGTPRDDFDIFIINVVDGTLNQLTEDGVNADPDWQPCSVVR